MRAPSDLNDFHNAFYASAVEAAATGEPYRAPHQRTTDAAPAEKSVPGTYVGSYRHIGPKVIKLSEK
jgi:hypothetical protein